MSLLCSKSWKKEWLFQYWYHPHVLCTVQYKKVLILKDLWIINKYYGKTKRERVDSLRQIVLPENCQKYEFHFLTNRWWFVCIFKQRTKWLIKRVHLDKKENAVLIDYFISFSTFVTLKLKIIIIWHFLNYKTTESEWMKWSVFLHRNISAERKYFET